MIGEHVAEIVEHGRIIGVTDQNFPEQLFRWLKFFLPLERRSPQERDLFLVFRLGRELIGFVQGGVCVLPALKAVIDGGQVHINFAVLRVPLEQ